MQLDSNFTKISVEEHAEVVMEMAMATPEIQHRYWTAELDGLSVKGERVQMQRFGTSPDDAIKNLFEAMSEVGVTL